MRLPSSNIYILIGACTIVLWGTLTGPAAAQTTFGSITGLVSDQSGAVIPDAAVTVTNEQTGVARRTTTSGAGVFNVPNLNVGAYRVRVEVKGFRIEERTGLVLNANQVINVNVALQVAATTTTTEVVGAASAIDTETSTLAYVKTSRDLQQLPLVARTAGDFGFYGYTIFNPGVSKVAGQSNPAVNGMRILDTVPTIDGIAVLAYLDGIGGGPVQPSLEGIEQVNIELANPQAEFARPGNFTVVTKSGTNDFHGGAFWDYNGNRLNARSFFAASKPFRIYHNFGASIGGPIRKNKTFFFADYEGGRESAKTVLVGSTPLVPWRSGDFSGLRTITDPLTGQPFPGNQVPASRINPVAQKAQDFFFPLPNFGPPGLQSGNWRGQRFGQSGFTRFDNVDARVDHNFSSRDSVYTRVSYRRLPVLGYENTLPPVGQRDQLRNTRSAVASWTHSFSPTVLNEARMGFTRMRNFFEPDLIGRDLLQQLGIQGIGVGDPIHNVPAFNITGITSTDQPNSNTVSLNTNFEWTDNLSWTRGAHFMKFGFDAIRDQLGGYSYPNSIYGSYNFTGAITGFGYADFLLGIPQTTSRTVPTRARYLRGTMWSLYAQDQFKVSRKLTLNYGLRWELQGPYYDRFGAIFSFDPATGDIVVPDSGVPLINPLFPKNVPVIPASQVGFPQGGLVDFDKNNFYPRFGFAYKPFSDDKTVIRGGYGLYGNTIYGSAGSGRAGGPFAGSETFTNVLTNGVPLFSFPRPFLDAGTTSTQNASGINPHLRTPYSQQYNLTVERQVGQIGIRIGYVGTHSSKLVYARNLNEPPASTILFSTSRRPYRIFNTVTWYDNGGNQQYNALQASASKTYGKDLFFNAGWTWAKDTTDTQNTGSGFSGPTIENQFDRRVERADNVLTRTHRVYANVIYTLPVGQGQHFGANTAKPLEVLLGGWNISWIAVTQSGQFFTPTFSGFDPSNTNTIGGRPDRIGSGQISNPSLQQWFNPAAFKVPGCPDSDPVCKSPAGVGRFGNSGTNILRGPRSTNFDFSAMKYFKLAESKRIQFRALMTNVFNHPNFANPALNISSPGTVGQITGTFSEQVGEDARQIHFSLRLEF